MHDTKEAGRLAKVFIGQSHADKRGDKIELKLVSDTILDTVPVPE